MLCYYSLECSRCSFWPMSHPKPLIIFLSVQQQSKSKQPTVLWTISKPNHFANRKLHGKANQREQQVWFAWPGQQHSGTVARLRQGQAPKQDGWLSHKRGRHPSYLPGQSNWSINNSAKHLGQQWYSKHPRLSMMSFPNVTSNLCWAGFPLTKTRTERKCHDRSYRWGPDESWTSVVDSDSI